MGLEVERYEELDIDDLVVDRFQVRTTNTADGIDELAASIEGLGLLHPIIVCRSERDGSKWEVVCGQRRLLAFKKLGRTTVPAAVYDSVLTMDQGTAVSANENIHQLQMSRPDLVDLCERLYIRYGTLQSVADKTKIPYHVVSKYVRIARLDSQLREMVENREVELDMAVKVQDAATVSGVFESAEALKLIEVLKRSDNDLRKRILRKKRENPEMDLATVQEEAEKPDETVKISGSLGGVYASGIRRLASDKGSNVSSVALDLIEEALDAQGYAEAE